MAQLRLDVPKASFRSVDDARNDGSALLARAQRGNQPPGGRHRRCEGLDEQRGAEDLHRCIEVDRAAAEAAVLGSERQRQQAHRREIAPQRSAEAVARRDDRLARLEAVAALEQSARGVGEQPLLLGVLEIHR